MYRSFQTIDVSQDHAVKAWDSYISETLIGVECASDRSGFFDASFQQVAIRDTSVSRIISTPETGSTINVSLSDKFAREAPEDSLLVLWQKSGAVDVSHNEHEINLTQGNALIIDPTRAYRMEVAAKIEQIVFSVSRHKAIANGLWAMDSSRSIIPIGTRQALFMNNMVSGLCDHGDMLNDLQAYRMMNVANDILLDHLTETLLEIDGKRAELRRRHLLLEIKAFVESMISNTDLTPEKIANTFKISRRHLDQLFSERGLTTAKFVTERRVSKATEMLTSSEFEDMSIAQIAFAVGFNDLSYFNRCFKRQLGLTPSEFRQVELVKGTRSK